MRIILLQDIKNLGKKGDIKEVAEGYAQNFLLPKKMAEIATDSAIEIAKIRKEKEKSLKMSEAEESRKLAGKLKNKKITRKVKEKDGKLFGSVTVKNISEELQKEGLNILPSSIIIKEAIKKIGEYEIEIKLSDEIRTKIKLEVKGN